MGTPDATLGPTAVSGVHTRLPSLAHVRLAAAVVAIAAALCAGWEGMLAAQGAQPDPLPTELDHWLREYRRITPDSVVFVGSSRTQQGISPVEVSRVLGLRHEQVINLGISAGPGLQMLEHMAAQADFRGALVVEILPTHDFGGEPSAMQTACLEQLVRPLPYLDTELAIHAAARANLRTAGDDGGPLAVARAALWRLRGEERPPDKIAQHLHADRWREILIPPRDTAEAARVAATVAPDFERWGTPPAPGRLQSLLARFTAAVRALETRGVTVLLVRMPSGHSVREAEERRFSRSNYWDALVRELPGRCWHFEDDIVAWALPTFDGSHLRGEDAVKLSQRLGELLKERLARNKR